MSGHSKWSTIKHKKAATDAKRSKTWSKMSRDITVAARVGGGDPSSNPRLRLAIDKARGANMPKDNIDKAIKKGTGDLEGVAYEEILYEGYGPGGVAVMVQALTDNRSRTAPEIKKIFERKNGNLGATNCVAWMFQQKGVIVVARADVEEDQLIEIAIDNGAEDVTTSEQIYEVTSDPSSFESVRDAIRTAEIPIQSADLSMVSENSVALDAEAARKVLVLVEALEDHDDVQSVATNFDISDEVLAQLAADR
ncbi:MAG: YebC/PmpR family DNA-binding transcriptional regulator [Phycisphaerae bacterium]|nr:YebC/PmpR family DNA-binding transcriptional regulator [Phycisphaerae bacterium]